MNSAHEPEAVTSINLESTSAASSQRSHKMNHILDKIWLLLDVRAILLFLILFLLLHRFLKTRLLNLPPGPMSVPVVGFLPVIVWNVLRGWEPHHVFDRCASKYGSVYRVTLFNKTVVLLSDFQAVQDAFRNPQLNDRPETLGQGISGISGERWLTIRRFCLTVLRSFGVGKSIFADQIGIEGEELLREMTALDGKPFYPKILLGNAVSNVIMSVVFGKRYSYNDAEFVRLLHSLKCLVGSTGIGGVLVFFQLRFARFVNKKLSASVAVTKFIRSNVDLRRANIDADNLKCFTDVYLMEMRKKISKGVSESNGHHFNETTLEFTVRDLFSAGSETTATSLEWCIMYMVMYPHIQERVQAEMDSVVGRNRRPRLTDKPNLNLTMAVIWEVQRIASIVPLGLPHQAASDTQLHGYLIPKGTLLVANLWKISHDPELWPEPEKFKPERFLDEEGKAFTPEEFIPFSIGRRICLGEHLAKMEIFIFFSYFMHEFTFKKPADSPPLSAKGKSGLTYTPLPFNICATKRE